jgi:hypothetical protein
MQKQIDTLSAHSSARTLLSQAHQAQESSKLQGTYHIVCTAPPPEYLKNYLLYREELELCNKHKMWELSDYMQSKLDCIPMVEQWRGEVPNLVTTVGGNFALDTLLSGSAYTAGWFLGLISATGYTAVALGDTSAAHAGWTESVAYSNATRPATAWSAAAAKSKTLSAGSVFNMNAVDTIKGCFLINNSAKSGTTGTLYSAGLFTGGDQPVANSNVLTVTYTATV